LWDFSVRNIKLTLEYDGTNFVGWQVQPNGRSVQAELEKALMQILQVECKTNAAGRTDSGVHASGQVANFLTAEVFSLSQLENSLNGVLPEDIAVLRIEEAAEQFHARYGAVARRYQYHIVRSRSALRRAFAWEVGYRLNVPAMQHCAGIISGEHDFQSYCKVESGVDHHRCTVQSAKWVENGSSLVFDIIANRFLHGMVRALVGTMVDVGRGHTSIERFQEILSLKNRGEAGMAAPSKGLFLEEVYY
jgi:tRNA pseudouridine38-40 synthase